ncbi:MAG: hypothetical protein HQ510_08775 [Candidatus Marinimicrobia bacterium]|nr:hypothetical protein [Candidatus Neomarinimicrobiota bacterium]
MKTIFWISALILFSGCGIFDSHKEDTNGPATKLYVVLQGLDQIAVYDADNQELIRTIDTDFTADQSGNTPHFVAIDDENGYWFATAISSGYVAMYDMDSDTLIDTLMVGDSPALMAIDFVQQRLFCSRMMPMGGMMSSSVSQVIQEIDYSTGQLQSIAEFEVDSPAPHGITLDVVNNWIVTTSNTADWIYKIDITTEVVEGQALDSQIGALPNNEIQRMKPIQCVTVAPGKALVTCSAGIWMDYYGNQTHIPGMLQLWDTQTMTVLDTMQLNWHSKPWHAVKSSVSDKIFITLSGDIQVSASAGVACARYEDDELHLEWISRSDEFHTLHGIDVSYDESQVFVSSRSNGKLYTLDARTGEIISTMLLSNNPDMVMAGGVAVMKNN